MDRRHLRYVRIRRSKRSLRLPSARLPQYCAAAGPLGCCASSAQFCPDSGGGEATRRGGGSGRRSRAGHQRAASLPVRTCPCSRGAPKPAPGSRPPVGDAPVAASSPRCPPSRPRRPSPPPTSTGLSATALSTPALLVPRWRRGVGVRPDAVASAGRLLDRRLVNAVLGDREPSRWLLPEPGDEPMRCSFGSTLEIQKLIVGWNWWARGIHRAGARGRTEHVY